MTNLQNQLDKTIIENGYHGWNAETLTEVNGQAFKICTMKRYNGKITSTSQPCEILPDGGLLFNDMMNFEGKNLTLITETGRATEKTIKDQHNKALILFDEQVKEVQPVKEDKPTIGTIIFLDGYGKGKGCKGNAHVVYEVENSKFGINYKTVELTTLELQFKNHVKNYKDKFGIGSYFEPDYKFKGSQDDLNNLVIAAKQKQVDDSKKVEAAKLMNEQITAGKIEEGKKLVTIPSYAKTVIVADDYQDDSDSMTDYFSTRVNKTYFLAWSKTDRNNMDELKKACLNSNLTKELLKEDTCEEYTRGHSYLPDYFIGTSRWFGLKVNKRKYFDLTNEDHRNKIYIAAAEGRFFIPAEETKPETEAVKTDLGDIQIIDYSEKALAIIGDTKPIKDLLKKIGARFNPRLTCGAGWIIAKSKENDLNALFN